MGQEAREREGVFRYFNGVKHVYGDPLRIQRELYLKLGDPDAAFDAAYGAKTGPLPAGGQEEKFDSERIHALNVIIDNAREAFRMAPLDEDTGEGATDEHVEDALAALWDYLEKKSKNTDMKPSSEPSSTSIPTPCPTKP